MKPSCAVTKLMLAPGVRPSSAKRSLLPASREASSTDHASASFPEAPDAIAVFAVPFTPKEREITDPGNHQDQYPTVRR